MFYAITMKNLSVTNYVNFDKSVFKAACLHFAHFECGFVEGFGFRFSKALHIPSLDARFALDPSCAEGATALSTASSLAAIGNS